MIDKAKIEKWLELVRISDLPYASETHPDGYVMPGDIWSEADYLPAAGEALPLLLAEREELLALLRRIEWGGAGARQEGAHICPLCGAYGGLIHEPVHGEHAAGCRLSAFLR